ncbi:MAG: hemerythrin domain-containing protein [Bacteroidetes bacterium]|nr:hemerythrin domain-containing protein [Bacteroidota bacterium]MBK9414362.1 hemerythrin domain-containing protein [Bacteroidota bacterium]MBL0030920.1 hemerythrin domain-containing protein [Bacteroidota bacterium]MBP6658004.1 hemerythrin domain-containing protein [Bacteroidia bacterium]
MTTPIKRHNSLQPLSRDHHDGLLLKWKINKGLSKGVDVSRIQKYVDWFFKEHLIPHFRIEEDHLFTIDKESSSVKQALLQHKELVEVFNIEIKDAETLIKIGDLLEEHIRFEERVLFNELQTKATESELKEIEVLHYKGTSCDLVEDKFWV